MRQPLRHRLLALQDRQRERYRSSAIYDLPDDLAAAWEADALTLWERRTVLRAAIAALVIHPRAAGSRRDRFDPRRIEVRWA
jgi:hypothetical protein